MHSGGGNCNGGSSSSVVSVAPATPMVKNMIGIAALVLEGRDRDNDLNSHNNKSRDTPNTTLPLSKRLTAMASTSGASTSASLLYSALDSTAVAAAMATSTASTATTSNWARAQNNRLAHIYRLKNRLLVETNHQQSTQQRSSPVPLDYDQLMAGTGAFGSDDDIAALVGGVFDPLQHLTGRTCRMTMPRSFLNLQMDKRHTSVSSNSSTGSSTGGGGSGGAVGGGSGVSSGRRNSRSSPVPVIVSTPRTHCDDFLRAIGLLKAEGTFNPLGGVGPSSPIALKKMRDVGEVEDESHFCDEVLNAECFRWQQFLRKIETLLCRGSSMCIEVSLGPETHPLLLEQWVIQRTERPCQPSMTIQSLCSAIRSQLHFSQISAWSDLLEQQYMDYAFYQEHILNNPRITVSRSMNRPRLDLLYRVKCASTQRGTFERPPVVHNFPNVIIDSLTGIAVSLRSLPRLERIPRLSVENKKSDMMEVTVTESEILPSPLMQAGNVCCQAKNKHRCGKLDEVPSSQSSTAGESCSSGSGPGLSHREKQLLKYKKRLLKRDKGGKEHRDAMEKQHAVSRKDCQDPKVEIMAAASPSSSTRINDLRLPLYTGDVQRQVEELDAAVHCQDVSTQTDLQMSIDDELVEMEVDEEDWGEEVMMVGNDVGHGQLRRVSCKDCHETMQLICWQCCDSTRKRIQRLREKYRNAMVAKKAANSGGGGRVFYKIPKNNRIATRSSLKFMTTATNSVVGRTPKMTTTSSSSSMSDDIEGQGGEDSSSSSVSLTGNTEDKDGGKVSNWMDHHQLEDNNNVAFVADRNNVMVGKPEGDTCCSVKQSNDLKISDTRVHLQSHRSKSNKNKRQDVVRTEFTSLTCDLSKGSSTLFITEESLDRAASNGKLLAIDADDLEQRSYHTPTIEPKCLSGVKVDAGKPMHSTELEPREGSMKLLKQDHDTISSGAAKLVKSSVHCIKNLTSIFTSATAAAMMEKPPTPQVVLKKLNLLPPNVMAESQSTRRSAGETDARNQSEVFNFDLVTMEKNIKMDSEIRSSDSRMHQFASGVKKSLSTPSAWVSNAEHSEPGSSCKTSPTPNCLSPRFLKSASVYNKKQRRSRHFSDRSSERSSVCSDELSLSDDETLLLTPNGSNLLLTAGSLLMPGRANGVSANVVDGVSRAGMARSLFKGSFGHLPLLGSIEESLLQRRLTPKFLVSGFRVLLGASGGFCPKQLTIPAKTFFYEMTGQSQTTPYMSEVRLPRKGYTIPRNGTVQVTLLNPLGTFVHMFVVPYDFREMPPIATTFIRQRSLMFDDTNSKTSGKAINELSTVEQMRLLRYVIHLRFQTTRSGRLVLHSDIRMLILRRTDHDTAAAHAKGALESPNELKTITIMPDNPRFSERIDKI